MGQEPRIAKVGDSSVARFSLATSEIFKDRNGDIKEEVTWHNICVWAARGMPQLSDIKKGQLVYVLGRIRNVKYTSMEGEDRHYQEIVATKLDFVNPDGLRQE